MLVHLSFLPADTCWHANRDICVFLTTQKTSMHFTTHRLTAYSLDTDDAHTLFTGNTWDHRLNANVVSRHWMLLTVCSNGWGWCDAQKQLVIMKDSNTTLQTCMPWNYKGTERWIGSVCKSRPLPKCCHDLMQRCATDQYKEYTSGRWNLRTQAHHGISDVSNRTGSSCVLAIGDSSSSFRRAISASITWVALCKLISTLAAYSHRMPREDANSVI